MARGPLRLRSASCQIAYWEGGQLHIANYLTRRSFSTHPETLNLIRFFFAPRTIREAFLEFQSYSRESIGRAIVKLIDAQLLLEQGSAELKRDEHIASSWRTWLPDGAFHFMTKDTPYVPRTWSPEKRLSLLPPTPPPPQFKRVRSVSRVRLASQAVVPDAFFTALHARRTHREFARGKISLENVSRLLQTTWGVQGYVDAGVLGNLPYKTSPSGGSRHPGEVYLVALRVEGLESGIYHYQCKDNQLARLSVKVSPRLASAYCADQPYCANAAALFIMTAVFARTMWKYSRARAYRIVLLETGHLCQTFCLTATRLGLAPFSTAALRDSVIERDLGIDGVSESVLYVAGVGLPVNRLQRLKKQPRRKAGASRSS
jgi:SagB-type dehydrogenase family enzyme